ncbi:PhzF family phenazine biosynthesis protein [Reinekea forsetii]|nr:PhzF family phenazine biosynthesis protein [Reinekea forsetii]
MALFKVAAFSDGQQGGNPAGVYISDQHPEESEMRAIAAELGYSETAFAAPIEKGGNARSWRVRYFSPESEVPFCGHATIALGAVLSKEFGPAVYKLQLNNANITVEASKNENLYIAALQSPATRSQIASDALVQSALGLFNLDANDLDSRLPPYIAHGGADHLILSMKNRELLAGMSYVQSAGRDFMLANGLVTVMLVYAQSNTVFHSRNPFASGGVYEDPATGAASAAFAGYLRDIDWPHENSIQIIQGEDMGARSLLKVELSNEKGASVRVSGSARFIAD